MISASRSRALADDPDADIGAMQLGDILENEAAQQIEQEHDLGSAGAPSSRN